MTPTIRLTPPQANLLEEASGAMGITEPEAEEGDEYDVGVRRLKDLDADEAWEVLAFIDNMKLEMEAQATWNAAGDAPYQIAFAELQFRNTGRALPRKIERHFGIRYPDIFPGRY